MIERNYETKFSIMMFENWVPNNSMTFLSKSGNKTIEPDDKVLFDITLQNPGKTPAQKIIYCSQINKTEEFPATEIISELKKKRL